MYTHAYLPQTGPKTFDISEFIQLKFVPLLLVILTGKGLGRF